MSANDSFVPILVVCSPTKMGIKCRILTTRSMLIDTQFQRDMIGLSSLAIGRLAVDFAVVGLARSSTIVVSCL